MLVASHAGGSESPIFLEKRLGYKFNHLSRIYLSHSNVISNFETTSH